MIFVNRTAFPMHHAIVHPGDRVALAPPGVPGPHRLLLGFKNIVRAGKTMCRLVSRSGNISRTRWIFCIAV